MLCSVQLELIQSIVAEVNKKTGEAECQFYRRGLYYLEDSQRLPEIQQSRFLYCHGELKNNKGQVDSHSSYLFDSGFFCENVCMRFVENTLMRPLLTPFSGFTCSSSSWHWS